MDGGGGEVKWQSSAAGRISQGKESLVTERTLTGGASKQPLSENKHQSVQFCFITPVHHYVGRESCISA